MITDKNTGVVYKEWRTPDPKAVFLLVHGLGGHAGRWSFLADYFLRNRISSYAIGLKGFGRTKGLSGHVDSFETYFGDIRTLRGIIGKADNGKKVFLTGESVGGVLSFLMAAAEPRSFDGLICVSPAFASRLKVSFFDYAKMLTPLLYNPKKQFTVPFDSRMCTRDAAVQRAMDDDPCEHRFATSRFIFNLMTAQIKSGIVKGRIKMPVLFLLSGNDKLVDPPASKRIFNGLKAKDKSLIEYPDMYHALSIDLGRERVFKDMLDWVRKRL